MTSMIRAVAVAAVALAAPAYAQLPGGLTLQAGPSLPTIVIQPGAEQALQVGAGAGVQVAVSHPSFERDLGGQRWTLMSIVGMAFGRIVSPASPSRAFGELALAGGACTFSGLACAGVGRPVVTFGPARPGWFFWLGGGFNFELGAEVALAGGPIRANTVRITW